MPKLVRSATALLLAVAAFAVLAPELTARASARPVPIRAKSVNGPPWNKLIVLAPPKRYKRVYFRVTTVPRGQRLLVRTAGAKRSCKTAPRRWNTKTTPWRSPTLKVRAGCPLSIQVLVRRNDAKMTVKFFALP